MNWGAGGTNMNFIIKTAKDIEKGHIEIRCNAIDFTYTKELVNYIHHHDKKIKVYDDERNMFLLSYALIYYIECIDNKTFIYTKHDAYRCFIHFSDLKKECYPYGFRQINKNTIVNIHYISSVKIIEDCRRLVSLKNDEQLIVNRNYRNFMNDL